MYGIFTYIWLIFMVNVGKYTIHGWHGIDYHGILEESFFTKCTIYNRFWSRSQILYLLVCRLERYFLSICTGYFPVVSVISEYIQLTSVLFHLRLLKSLETSIKNRNHSSHYQSLLTGVPYITPSSLRLMTHQEPEISRPRRQKSPPWAIENARPWSLASLPRVAPWTPKPKEADSGDLETPTSPDSMSSAYEVERYKDDTGWNFFL